VNRYLKEHLEAFTIGRSDWEYITNTFVFIAKTGYRFMRRRSELRAARWWVSARTP